MKLIGGSNSGLVIGPGAISMEPIQSIQFDAGPITVIVDGKILRQERSAPLYLLGDQNGQPIPITTLIPIDGRKEVTVIEGPNQDVTTLAISVLKPVPQLRKVWSQADTGMTGISTINNPQNPAAEVIPAGGITGVHVRGYSQNITILDAKDYSFSDGISSDSYAGAGDYNEGQGLYCHADWESGTVKWLGGNIVVSDWVFDKNGWDAFRKISEKTQFRHNFYGNKRAPGKSFTFNRCTFSRPASIGAKLMGDAVLNDCNFYLCAIGVQSIYGTVTLNNPIFFRGSYHFAKKQDGSNALIGQCAIDAYTKTIVNNPLFIGGPADERLGNVDPNPYNVGMLSLNKTHDKYKDVTGADVTLSGNSRVYGWTPKSNTNSLVNGDPSRLKGGYVVKSTAGKTYDPQPMFDKLYAGSISRIDFNARLRADLYALEN